MPEALKPCPCCGSGLARGFGHMTQASFSGVEVMDECGNPYVWCGTCCLQTRLCQTVDEAITAWNTRTTDPEIARLQDLVAKFQRGGVSTLFAEGNVDG